MHCLSGLAAREWSGQRVRLPLEPLTKTLCSSSHARRARSREGGAGGGSKLCAVCGVAGQAPLVGIPRGFAPPVPSHVHSRLCMVMCVWCWWHTVGGPSCVRSSVWSECVTSAPLPRTPRLERASTLKYPKPQISH